LNALKERLKIFNLYDIMQILEPSMAMTEFIQDIDSDWSCLLQCMSPILAQSVT
jgi:hypothetical protein